VVRWIVNIAIHIHIRIIYFKICLRSGRKTIKMERTKNSKENSKTMSGKSGMTQLIVGADNEFAIIFMGIGIGWAIPKKQPTKNGDKS